MTKKKPTTTDKVVRLVRDTGEQAQGDRRFQWKEASNGFYVVDIWTGETKGMGDGVDMFHGEEPHERLIPGTQEFYDALNMYFEGEQDEIEEIYFKGEDPCQTLKAKGAIETLGRAFSWIEDHRTSIPFDSGEHDSLMAAQDILTEKKEEIKKIYFKGEDPCQERSE